MDVDFNSLRMQTCFAYDRLTRKLNESLSENVLYNEKGIDILASEIQEEMDELRQCIMALAWTRIEGNENFKFVGEEVKPIAWFNEEEQDG